METKNSFLGIFNAIMYAIIISVLGIIIKIAYHNNIDKFAVFFLGYALASIFLGFIVFVKNKKLFLINKKQLIYTFFMGSVLFIFLTTLNIFLSLEYIEVNIQKPISACHSLVTVILSILYYKKAPSNYKLISCFLVVSGLALIILNADITKQNNLILGSVLSFCVAITLSLYSFLKQIIKIDIDNLTFTFYSFLFASFLSGVLFLFKSNYILGDLTLKSIGLIALISMIFIGSFFTFTMAIKKIGALNTSLIGASSPILTMFLSSFFLKESLTFLQLCGTILIVISSILVVLSVKKESEIK